MCSAKVGDLYYKSLNHLNFSSFSMSVTNKPTEHADEIGLFTLDTIENTEGLMLGGLLLLALLSGRDYAAGLEGCSEVTAHGLAKCGFGDKLLRATPYMVKIFLPSWYPGLMVSTMNWSLICMASLPHANWPLLMLSHLTFLW